MPRFCSRTVAFSLFLLLTSALAAPSSAVAGPDDKTRGRGGGGIKVALTPALQEAAAAVGSSSTDPLWPHAVTLAGLLPPEVQAEIAAALPPASAGGAAVRSAWEVEVSRVLCGGDLAAPRDAGLLPNRVVAYEVATALLWDMLGVGMGFPGPIKDRAYLEIVDPSHYPDRDGMTEEALLGIARGARLWAHCLPSAAPFQKAEASLKARFFDVLGHVGRARFFGLWYYDVPPMLQWEEIASRAIIVRADPSADPWAVVDATFPKFDALAAGRLAFEYDPAPADAQAHAERILRAVRGARARHAPDSPTGLVLAWLEGAWSSSAPGATLTAFEPSFSGEWADLPCGRAGGVPVEIEATSRATNALAPSGLDASTRQARITALRGQTASWSKRIGTLERELRGLTFGDLHPPDGMSRSDAIAALENDKSLLTAESFAASRVIRLLEAEDREEEAWAARGEGAALREAWARYGVESTVVLNVIARATGPAGPISASREVEFQLRTAGTDGAATQRRLTREAACGLVAELGGATLTAHRAHMASQVIQVALNSGWTPKAVAADGSPLPPFSPPAAAAGSADAEAVDFAAHPTTLSLTTLLKKLAIW